MSEPLPRRLRDFQTADGDREALECAAASRVMAYAALPHTSALESLLARSSGATPAAPVGGQGRHEWEEHLRQLVTCAVRACLEAASKSTEEVGLPQMPLMPCYGADEATWWRIIYKAVQCELADAVPQANESS